MNAARQACRPKHQVLVLKCYPKFQKNNVEVRANSSELSYLLYYASTRRSKIQKVCDFLDKRTTADVWKGRIGNVQVTLEILKALIEKCPRDLPLYANAVLRVLRAILKSNDVTMVEESVPAFEALCAHQDPANLAADQDYIRQYEEAVALYAHFASKDVGKDSKTPVSWPVAVRFRKAGLRALKAVASSDSLGSETSRQLAVIVPIILSNMYSSTGDYLKRLEYRDHEREGYDKDTALRRRQSISTVRTADDEEADAAAAAATTEDADKLAEEEVGVVALQALRNIFLGVNRGQLRLATSAVLKFIGANVRYQEHFADQSLRNRTWPTTLMAMICGWAPVQDRYAILVGAMETLVRSPFVEDDLERQLVLATVIDYLLSSTINFIGLSVMDVLVGLITHILLLLQLGGSVGTIAPHHQQTTPVYSEKPLADATVPGSLDGVVVEVVKEASPARLLLLEILQKCMSSLATHVYYTDQISDMIAAILSRLKPSAASGVSSMDAIEDPSAAVNAVASSASLHEKTGHVDRFFSFETARLRALEAVKNILITANTRRPDGSSASVSRSPVGVRVWEGTQWLLRDPSAKVRKAYIDSLITWLNLEKKKVDLRIVEDYRKKEKESDKGGLARRAVSNASHREKSSKKGKNTFLALLHLAIYEDAFHYADSEPDLILLHLVLTTSVNKLGVNAARHGLPMILKLQEDIPSIENPASKVRIGSLVHGYLWALSMALDFETSTVGREIHAEISRRNSKGIWVRGIRVPPTPLDRIDLPQAGSVRLSTEIVQHEAIKPFDHKDALIDVIASGYSSSLYSPPSSPPGSPGRALSISVPIIKAQTTKPPPQLPQKVIDDLKSEWTREVCIAANTKDTSSASVTGSRTVASTQQKNNYLGISIPNGTLDSPAHSPQPTPRRAHSRPPSMAYGLVGRMGSPRRTHSPSATPASSSSIRSAVRVEDLKRVLSGSAPRTSYSIRPASHHHHRRTGSTRTRSPPESSASESMLSVHSLSDASFVTAEHASSPQVQQQHQQQQQQQQLVLDGDSPTTPRPATATATATSSPSSAATHAARSHDAAFTAGVPPVPPIPASLRTHSVSPPGTTRPKTAPSNGNGNGNGNGSIAVRKSRSLKRSSAAAGAGARSVHEIEGSGGRPDFSGFLDSIDVGDDGDGDG
ncbi:hypothetical protein BDV96DRAFT_472815, partial [Lophiotrema nucula]